MTEGRNIVLLGVLILGLNFLFRLFFIRLKKRSRFLLFFFIILFYFLKYLYLYYPRVYLLSWFGPCLSGIFSTFFIFHVSGEQGLPLPTPSGASSECSVNQAPGGNDAGPSNAVPSNAAPADSPWGSFPSVPSSLTPLPSSPYVPSLHSMEENNPSDREQPEGAVEQSKELISDFKEYQYEKIRHRITILTPKKGIHVR